MAENSPDKPPSQRQLRRRRFSLWLAVAFAVALLMGAGPGVLFANVPRPVFGLPALYVWGLAWWAVEVAVVIAAYWLVWTADDAGPHDSRSP